MLKQGLSSPIRIGIVIPNPHHRSLWLGCDPVNGGNYWSDGPLDEGQVRSVKLELGAVAPDKNSVGFTQRCEWIRTQAGSPLTEERRYLVTILSTVGWNELRAVPAERGV
ncbi:MAG: DUF6807 family protein [Pirellulales bacterium]